MKKLKVAVCLCGQLRTVRTAAPGILRFFQSAQPDYFAHTWDHSNWMQCNDDKCNPSNFDFVPIEDFQYVKEKFQPIHFKIEPVIHFEVPVSQSQQYSMMKAIHLKQEYEKSLNFKYDIVVKCRYDLLWPPNKEFNLDLPATNTAYFQFIDRVQFPNYPMALDAYFYGNSCTMDKISDIFNDTTKNIVNGIRSKLIEPEFALYQFCIDNNIALKETNLYNIVVRKNAMGLDHFRDYDKIEEIHQNFYKTKTSEK